MGSKRGAMLRSLDRRDRAREKKQKDPRLKPSGESIPDLWAIDGVNYPGSPKITNNEPEEILMVNARGDRVCIALKKYQVFSKKGKADIGLYLLKPQFVPGLWSGSRHVCLTHALRLFQRCSTTFEGQHRNPHLRMVRGDINPRTLLEECGLSSDRAATIVTMLQEQGTLSPGQCEGKPCWFVDMRWRGFAADLMKFTGHELGDGLVLPEFLPPSVPTAVVAEQPEEEPAEEPEAEAAEETAVEPREELAKGGVEMPKKRRMRTDEEHQQDLQKAYDTLMLLEAIESTAEGDGSVVFTFHGSAHDAVKRATGGNDTATSKLLAELKLLGISEGISSTRGISKRRIVPDITITLEMVRRVREHHAQQVQNYVKGKKGDAAPAERAEKPKEEKPEAEPKAKTESSARAEQTVDANPEQLSLILQEAHAELEESEAKIQSLTERLDTALAERATAVAELEAKLAESERLREEDRLRMAKEIEQLTTELEQARAASSGPTYQIPAGLAKRLEARLAKKDSGK